MITKRLLPLFLVYLLTLAQVAHAALAPDISVLTDALRSTPYESYTLSCQAFVTQYGEPGISSAYAIASKNGKNVLCAFQENEGDWHLRVANENALPEDATGMSIFVDDYNPLVTIAVETLSGGIQLQFSLIGSATDPYTWPLFAVTVTDGKTDAATRIAPDEETGRWTVTEDGDHKPYENRSHLFMDNFDLRDFPLTKAAADAIWHSGSTTVFLQEDDGRINTALFKLVGREVTLPGDLTLPVYSGPDISYPRGAGGKAAASTNEPVTIYATAQDWVLISYAVSSGERFGFVPRGYFPADVSIEHNLYQGNMSVGLTTREVAVLDNLSKPNEPLCILPYQSPLEVWATLGDWLYVSGVSASGTAFYGFIPADALHHTNNF